MSPKPKGRSLAFFQAFGKRIFELRRGIGMTQDELAIALGVSQQSVFAYELGDRRVPVDLLLKLAEIFQVSVGELLQIDSSLPQLPKRRLSSRQQTHLKLLADLSRTDQAFMKRVMVVLAERAKRS